MSNYWGYHLMLDCSGCNDSIKNRDDIYNFVTQLVNDINMIAHGEPVIEHLLPGEPNQGFSLLQMITTSNICAHFVDLDSTAYIDVFSCKKFNNDTVVQVVKQYFDPKKIRINFITRHAD